MDGPTILQGVYETYDKRPGISSSTGETESSLVFIGKYVPIQEMV